MVHSGINTDRCIRYSYALAHYHCHHSALVVITRMLSALSSIAEHCKDTGIPVIIWKITKMKNTGCMCRYWNNAECIRVIETLNCYHPQVSLHRQSRVSTISTILRLAKKNCLAKANRPLPIISRHLQLPRNQSSTLVEHDYPNVKFIVQYQIIHHGIVHYNEVQLQSDQNSQRY